MSIATEIQRLQTAKSDIKSILESKGVRVSDSDRISDYPQLSATIPNLLTPIYFDFPRGYVDNSGWKYEVLDPPKCFLDVYEVQNSHTYFVMVGGSVGTRFRVCTVTSDIKNATANIAAKDKVQATNNPNPYDTISKNSLPVFTATSDGYLVIQKDNAGKMGIRTIVFDITTPESVVLPIHGLDMVGGKIFYIDSNSDRDVQFYDSNGQELQGVSIGDSPAYYKVLSEGTSNKDKYYIYDNITGIVDDKTWGYYKTGPYFQSTKTLGYGKKNTSSVISYEDKSSFASSSIFTYLTTTQNFDLGVNGCNDWYIGNQGELNALNESGLTSYFSSEIWSSDTSSTNKSSSRWDGSDQTWYSTARNGRAGVIFIRSI